MPTAPRATAVLASAGIATLAVRPAALLLSGDLWTRLWPRALPNRLRKIEESDLATRIDNAVIYDEERFWWHPLQPLLKLNSARVPYFIAGLMRHFAGAALSHKPRILDLGCGAGLVTEELAKAGYEVTGIDLSARTISEARAHGRASGLDIEYVVGSVFDLPFEDSSFDAVLSSDVLEHLLDLPQAARELARVMRPGALFTFDTINRSWTSWLTAYLGAQEVTRILPPDAHRWELFITPTEVTRLLGGVGLTMAPDSERRGMRPTFRPLACLRALWSPKRPEDAPRRWHFVGPFELCQSDAANWLWQATKPVAAV